MKFSRLLLAGVTSVVFAQEIGHSDVVETHDQAYGHKGCGLDGVGEESLHLPVVDIFVSGENDVLNHYARNNTNSHPQEDINTTSAHNWSHTTPCFNSISSNDAFCIFTDTSYANGHGISFITTAQRAAYLASLPSFLSSFTTEPSPAWYTINSIPGKGLGLIATTRIPRGSLILSSHPTLMIDYRAFDKLLRTDYIFLQAAAISSLPLAHRSAFFSLSSMQSNVNATASGLSRIALSDSIITTNAFDIPPPSSPHPSSSSSSSSSPHDPIEDPNDSLWYTTFASPTSPISRLNHACRPNADYRFDWTNTNGGDGPGLVQVITAVRDILPGDEITISYINPLQTRQARQRHLKTVWGFECGCELCSQKEGRVEESDRRVRLIRKVRRPLKGEETDKEKMERTKMAELLVSLYKLEGLWGMIYEAYAIAAREYTKVGEAWMAMKWASRALEFGTMVLGEDDEEVREMKKLARDPWGHGSWGSKKNSERHEEKDAEDAAPEGDERPAGFGVDDGNDDEDDEEGW